MVLTLSDAPPVTVPKTAQDDDNQLHSLLNKILFSQYLLLCTRDTRAVSTNHLNSKICSSTLKSKVLKGFRFRLFVTTKGQRQNHRFMNIQFRLRLPIIGPEAKFRRTFFSKRTKSYYFFICEFRFLYFPNFYFQASLHFYIFPNNLFEIPIFRKKKHFEILQLLLL